MNEFATADALNLAMWVFGGISALLTILCGVIWHGNQAKHAEHKESIEWLREHHVSKEMFDRAERSWRDAIDAMAQQRREMHLENKDSLGEIKDTIGGLRDDITGVHRRIDQWIREQPTSGTRK